MYNRLFEGTTLIIANTIMVFKTYSDFFKLF